jgi:hypothetical protein
MGQINFLYVSEVTEIFNFVILLGMRDGGQGPRLA